MGHALIYTLTSFRIVFLQVVLRMVDAMAPSYRARAQGPLIYEIRFPFVLLHMLVGDK